MRNDGRVLLAVRNLYVRKKIRVAIFDTSHSDTDSTQSVAASIEELPDSKGTHSHTYCGKTVD
jgi:hypothetical protein